MIKFINLMKELLIKLQDLYYTKTGDLWDDANFIAAMEKYAEGRSSKNPVQNGYIRDLKKLDKTPEFKEVLSFYINFRITECSKYWIGHRVDFGPYLKDARGDWTLGISEKAEA